ncbi:MAG TPA: phosphoribosyltransferase family protein [Patescibacteria group bacterium]|nr:phosphoribosyltransferase family protein [Patescibacteria group bacterium]
MDVEYLSSPIYKLSWEILEKDCITLAKKIKKSGVRLDEIISISRGGVIVARLLSDLLNLPISHIAIESYVNLKREKEPVITQFSSRVFNNEIILLVDELSDSGKTFIKAFSYLSGLSIQKIITASPYIKPHTAHVPNFFVRKIDAWVVFPYEIRETQEAILRQFGEAKGKEKIREIGFVAWEILDKFLLQ